MSIKTTFFAAAVAALTAMPAFAEGIMIKDAYARAATPMAKTGAAFMVIMNHSGQDDRLVDATASVAKKVELHTHKEMGDGVMQMLHVPEGFAIADGDMLMLERGGKHVMMMGLTERFEQGKIVEITLTFENAGDVIVEVPVDLTRKGGHSEGHGEGHDEKHDHSHDDDHSHDHSHDH